MKVNINNEEKVMAQIDETETRCNARTLTHHDICDAIMVAEKKLSTLEIPKKGWIGCSIKIEPEKVVNSYQGIPQGTWAVITRFSSGWFITQCYRGHSGTQSYGQGKSYHLHLTANAKAAIPNRIKIY